MREKTGEVFSIAKDNTPVPGCTVSKEVQGGACGVVYFSLAAGMDISAESYPYHKLIIMARGDMEAYPARGAGKTMAEGDMLITPVDEPVGVRTAGGAIYTEIITGRGFDMNSAIKAGEVFRLAELVPYQDGRIVNMDVVHNDKMKFALMAFDEGTGLSPHSAPGEAIVFALDGEGIIGYGGTEHLIKAGENFHFAKNGLHYVKARGRFKMALLLTLE